MRFGGVFLLALLIPQPATAADAPSAKARNQQIRRVVFQSYPPRALAAGEDGPVFFTVVLDENGHPMTCHVTRGSGHPLLDAETCDLIVNYATFETARDANGHLISQGTQGVVNWTLPGHTPAPISFASAARTNLPGKEICKRELRPGNLSVYDRTCMTADEWQQRRNDLKNTFEQMQGKKASPSTVACIDPNGC